MSAMGRKRTFSGGWLPNAAGETYRYPAKHEVRPQQLPLGERMKTSVIAAALGLSLLAVFAWRDGHDAPVTSEAPTTSGSCYADGPGPNEPTLCS